MKEIMVIERHGAQFEIWRADALSQRVQSIWPTLEGALRFCARMGWSVTVARDQWPARSRNHPQPRP